MADRLADYGTRLVDDVELLWLNGIPGCIAFIRRIEEL
ncbi:uncharacterized protein An08g02140 [Aspergillus niger]|uniref:Contig An08c0070, genomic contig n=2 Tax=Aspergillus niger TaxID=5061 RepID=A2QQD5_ASPNC|nr:uncharacterized protein An08g02140 [Aspergillus niger]CAK45260.1 unnamed protein product [Aspergillus niger]